MTTMQAGEDLAARGATAPRVSLDDIKANVRSEYYVNAADAVDGGVPVDKALRLFTLCFLVMQNGYVIVGKSAPASEENFDAEKGRTFAKDDAMRQMWPLMGYALKERLAVDTAKAHAQWRDDEPAPGGGSSIVQPEADDAEHTAIRGID